MSGVPDLPDPADDPKGAVDPRFPAAVDMIGRTGAENVQIRYSDDETPMVWFVVASYPGGRWEVDAGDHPVTAILRLCERLIDGGTCAHCRKPSAFDPSRSFDGAFADQHLCWQQWDPELGRCRRGCE